LAEAFANAGRDPNTIVNIPHATAVRNQVFNAVLGRAAVDGSFQGDLAVLAGDADFTGIHVGIIAEPVADILPDTLVRALVAFRPTAGEIGPGRAVVARPIRGVRAVVARTILPVGTDGLVALVVIIGAFLTRSGGAGHITAPAADAGTVGAALDVFHITLVAVVGLALLRPLAEILIVILVVFGFPQKV